VALKPAHQLAGQPEVLHSFALSSQGFQELDDGFLIWAFQFFKLLSHVGSLAAVAYDGVEKCERGAIMHQSWAQSDAPQRSGADLVPTTLKILL